MALPALYATVHVRRQTPANPPVATTVIAIALLLIGFTLSMV
jgi:amino acid transporter